MSMITIRMAEARDIDGRMALVKRMLAHMTLGADITATTCREDRPEGAAAVRSIGGRALSKAA